MGLLGQGLVFLSHWSGDAAAVNQLYQILDRSRAFLDVLSMNAGQNNLEEMQRAVESASVFIFIISPQVPKDCFSFFEAECARYKKIRDKELQILVWPINGATFRDAPEWMRNYFSIPAEYTVADVGREVSSLVTY
jgi:TIR domain